MSGFRKVMVGALLMVGVAGLATAVNLGIRWYRRHHIPITLKGAVIKQDADPRRQSPIADVDVVSLDGLAAKDTKSNFSGAFFLTLRQGIKPGQPIRLAFRHPDFQPLELNERVSNELYVVRLVPLHSDDDAKPNQPETPITNVIIRYSTETTRTENVGTAVKTFQVINKGNVPCNKSQPCSLDNRWKAQVGNATLDAGPGRVFRDARVSCIAGPCPFTRIDDDSFSRGGQNISVTVRDWSDTTTFLLQAEVFRTHLVNLPHTAYPVIFGSSINFALPSTAEGPSIEADVNGTLTVFPLGPSPVLSWATCQVREERQARDYRCELKVGYTFR